MGVSMGKAKVTLEQVIEVFDKVWKESPVYGAFNVQLGGGVVHRLIATGEGWTRRDLDWFVEDMSKDKELREEYPDIPCLYDEKNHATEVCDKVWNNLSNVCRELGLDDDIYDIPCNVDPIPFITEGSLDEDGRRSTIEFYKENQNPRLKEMMLERGREI